MPIYQTKDHVTRGMPFGGIGAGKLEITPEGLFNAFTFQNNWSEPIQGDEEYPGILGFNLGFFGETSGAPTIHSRKKSSFLLQTTPLLGLPTVKNIRYEGAFPRAVLNYDMPGLGLDVSLEVFSPWLAGDTKNSSLPAVFFNLKVKNKTRKTVKAGFLFIGRNTCGEWCVGRQNRIFLDKDSVAVEFSNNDPTSRDMRQGALRFSFLKQNWDSSFMESWNAVTKNFSFSSKNISLAAWECFSQDGVLPNTRPSFIVRGENQELCASIMMTQSLPPDSQKNLLFTASWHFPKHPLGHYYERPFKKVSEANRYAVSHRGELQKKIRKFHSKINELPFPGWFNDALLTNLTPFFASSWYTKDQRFSFYEAPVICPLMGTVDVGFYGSIPLSYFFPELEKSLISQLANAQRDDGYIPHDLGKNRLDLPSNGTTFYFWKDLNPKFILMVYRDALWSGDQRFLKAMYPHVKKALAWSLTTDFDGNGLPDNEGEDQTFDLWEFRGTTAYTSGIFLAAVLACEKMALRMKDGPFLKNCREYFLKGKLSFERELWNGEYFGDACSLSQLNGQWYADLLDLGYIADKQKVRRALASIWKLNRHHSSFGMVNSVFRDGRLDISNNHSKNIWLGMNYAFMSLAIYQNFPLSDLLKEAYKIWDNVVRRQKSPWSMPDMINAKTGQFMFGDFYYRNMAIWAIPIAYAKRNKKTAEILRSLRSFK